MPGFRGAGEPCQETHETITLLRRRPASFAHVAAGRRHRAQAKGTLAHGFNNYAMHVPVTPMPPKSLRLLWLERQWAPSLAIRKDRTRHRTAGQVCENSIASNMTPTTYTKPCWRDRCASFKFFYITIIKSVRKTWESYLPTGLHFVTDARTKFFFCLFYAHDFWHFTS